MILSRWGRLSSEPQVPEEKTQKNTPRDMRPSENSLHVKRLS